MSTTVLRRRLFGFNPRAVHELLAERDFALGRAMDRASTMEREVAEARERVKAADQRVQETQDAARSTDARLHTVEEELATGQAELIEKSKELASLRREVSDLRDQIRRAEEQVRSDPQATPAGDPVLQLLVQGIAPIMDSARESAAIMLEEAARLADQRTGEAEVAARGIQEQERSMLAWWTGVNRLVDPMVGTLGEARVRIDEIPRRVQDALTPLTRLFAALRDQLDELARVSDPPHIQPVVGSLDKVVDLTEEGNGAQPDGGGIISLDPEGEAEVRPGPHWWPNPASPPGWAPARD